MSRQIDEVVQSLRDETRPLPAIVWAALALLGSTSLFLALRLLVVARMTAAERMPESVARPVLDVPIRRADPVAAAKPSHAGDAAGLTQAAKAPPASEEALRSLVEGWRKAWVGKDLSAFLAYYAPTFASDGRDLAGWREQKARVFASPTPVDVRIEDVSVAIHEAIAIVTFTQSYRAADYADRGKKSLYLLPHDGRWKIFFEEWKALP